MWDRRGRDRMVVGFTTTYAISAYHHWCCEFASWSGRDVQHYVIKFVSDLGQVWFSPGPSVSSTNKTDRLDITEILLKVALNIIKQTNILKLIELPGIHNVVKPSCHTTCLWFDTRQWYAPGSRYTATIKTHHQTIVEIIEYSDMATRTTASNR